MTHISKNVPLSALDHRLGKLLLKGSQEEFTIPCETENQAWQLRSQFNSYRFRMKKQHGDGAKEMWEPLYGCVVSKQGTNLVLKPRGSVLDKVLTGINLDDFNVPEAESYELPDSGSDLLASLKREQEKGG